MRILLAQPRGFCAGVVRAIETVERAAALADGPVYVRHEIVHNGEVVRSLAQRGVRFVETLRDVPRGSVTIFSAHGVSRAVEAEAKARGLFTIDATCPLVAKVHTQGRRYAAEGRTIVLIGHAGHPEVEGTIGQIPAPVHLIQSAEEVDRLPIAPDAPVAYVTQTTLSVEDTRSVIAALSRRFRDLKGPETRDICYATQNRQAAVRAMSRLVDVILVVGAHNSSNANRLAEIGAETGVPSYLVADGSAVNLEWVRDARTVGITAGASAPEVLVQDVIARLSELGPVEIATLPGEEENIEFRLPAELATLQAAVPAV